MSKKEFNSTIDMIRSEFPSTDNWLKWHFDNGSGPLIFRSLADECISGFGYDTNGEEGIGGWIKRSFGLSKPSFTQAVLHLVVFSKSDGNELNIGEWDILDCSSETPQQANGESIIKVQHTKSGYTAFTTQCFLPCCYRL